MFAALASILPPNQTLDLTITVTAEGLMKVVVKPQLVKGTNASLATPLALSATPQELDTDFVDTLMQFAGHRTSLQQQVDVTATILAEAKATEVTKASKAITKSSGKAGAIAAGGAADESDDDDETSGGESGSINGNDILDDNPATITSTPLKSAPAANSAASTTNDDLLSALMA